MAVQSVHTGKLNKLPRGFSDLGILGVLGKLLGLLGLRARHLTETQ